MRKRAILGVVIMAAVVSAVGVALTLQTRGSAQDLDTAPLAVTEQEPEPVLPAQEADLKTIRGEVTIKDLTAGSGYDAAAWAVYRGLLELNGTSFDPYAPASRADVAQALYRLSGESAPAERTNFTDVSQSSAYADAVAWVSAAGIASGTGAKTFAPEESVCRAQLAVMLQRYAARRGDDTSSSVSLSSYSDAGTVPSYAATAMAWALGKGIFRATVADTLYPMLPVSRLQLAQALAALESGVDDAAGEVLAETARKTAASGDAKAHHADIQAVVDSAAKKYGAVGVQVAVVENGQVTDTYAYGWATKNTDKMTADHKLRVASLSKVLVGVSAMILQEDGVVDLDTSIGSYWGFAVQNPKYPSVPITISTLLTHTSSIFNAGDDESRAYSSVVRRLKGSGYSSARPGDIGGWCYNNYGFAVLGMTLELASGQRLDDVLNQRLFTGMEIDASFAAGEIKNTNLLSTIYRSGSASRTVAYQKESIVWTGKAGSSGSYFAGGLTISARDLGKVVALLSGDGRFEGVQLLSKESVKQMETCNNQVLADGSYQGMPMRYRYNVFGRAGLYFHTGSAYGVYNSMTYDPATGDGVVVLTSGASGSKDSASGIYSVCAEISDYIYRTIQ